MSYWSDIKKINWEQKKPYISSFTYSSNGGNPFVEVNWSNGFSIDFKIVEACLEWTTFRTIARIESKDLLHKSIEFAKRQFKSDPQLANLPCLKSRVNY